jgi:hypothetical protein
VRRCVSGRRGSNRPGRDCIISLFRIFFFGMASFAGVEFLLWWPRALIWLPRGNGVRKNISDVFQHLKFTELPKLKLSALKPSSINGKSPTDCVAPMTSCGGRGFKSWGHGLYMGICIFFCLRHCIICWGWIIYYGDQELVIHLLIQFPRLGLGGNGVRKNISDVHISTPKIWWGIQTQVECSKALVD